MKVSTVPNTMRGEDLLSFKCTERLVPYSNVTLSSYTAIELATIPPEIQKSMRVTGEDVAMQVFYILDAENNL